MKEKNVEIKVGLFVVLGLGLTMAALLVLGSSQNFMTRNNVYVTHFPAVDGLIEGAKIVVSGISVGTIAKVKLEPTETSSDRRVRVEMRVARSYEDWIRADSAAEVLTQGVLGDKYISLKPGSSDQPKLPDGADIPAAPSKDLAQFLNKGDQLLVSLTSIAASMDRVMKTFESGRRAEIFFEGMATTAKNLSQASAPLQDSVKNLNQILAKVNNGTGTLGALVNDPGLYYDAKALLGGANRNRIIRNLVRQTVRDADEAEAKSAETPEHK